METQTTLFEKPPGDDPETARVGQASAGRPDEEGKSRVADQEAESSSGFWVRQRNMRIGFAELVRESCGHVVLAVDPCSKEDVLLLSHISQALTAFFHSAEKSGQRITGKRINDVGKRFEYIIAEALRKTPLEVSVLGRPGYPDCVIKQEAERITYLEIKTSASEKKTNTWLRNFSFSSGTKIKFDARHLLLKVQLEEEDHKIWKVVSWELRDLSTLRTRLRFEFNAGADHLQDVRLLGSSEMSQSPTLRGQSVLDDELAPLVVPLGRSRRRRVREGVTRERG